MSEKRIRSNKDGAVLGIVVLAIGSVLLIEKMGLIVLPSWTFSWQMLLIVLGFVIGARKNFKGGGWLAMMFIGVVFLAQEVDFFGVDMRQYLWPIALILFGFFCVVRSMMSSGNSFDWKKYAPKWDEDSKTWTGIGSDRTKGEFVDATAVLGGIKRRVFSKEFSGGDITCFLGSAEIDLSQADIIDPVVIDVSLVMGGLKLFVPSNWEIQSDITAVFGGVDDKRIHNSGTGSGTKRLILTGVCVFGGVEIKSF